MKPISPKAQRIIAFIPGINFLCVAIFVYNSFFCSKYTLKDFLRSWKAYLFPAIFFVILEAASIRLFPAASDVLRSVFSYLICLVVGLRLAGVQEYR